MSLALRTGSLEPDQRCSFSLSSRNLTASVVQARCAWKIPNKWTSPEIMKGVSRLSLPTSSYNASTVNRISQERAREIQTEAKSTAHKSSELMQHKESITKSVSQSSAWRTCAHCQALSLTRWVRMSRSLPKGKNWIDVINHRTKL